MKLLITSIDALIDNLTEDYFDGIKEALDYFESLNEDNTVVIISIHQDRLDAIPNDFEKVCVNANYRRGTGLIQYINNKIKINFSDILILGAKEDDLFLAANSKLVLLTADYARENNPDDKLYTYRYGIGILSPARLRYFFEHFLNINNPWYYRLKVDDSTELYGLTNAMTNMELNPDVKAIGNSLKGFLKSGITEFKNPFLIYSLISAYQNHSEFNEINYWGYYPSSTGKENEVLKTFKEVLRKTFSSSRKTDDILIRHKPSAARKNMSAAERISNGCNSEFDTIILNPVYKHLLRGKNVCIIDDYTTHGSSCETVRKLLKKAGVNKIIFIALGKFKVDYKIYDYEIDGDVYKVGYTYKCSGEFTAVRGTINPDYKTNLIESLNHLL
ncbi:phosphoribosyltransferase [Flavobacterium terrigena]|uniref:Phosphoribosyl transferase domain-containing protein n=1 Tax=Flavobacterium terrigena TaxID=402734 RepID=A0A1H6UYV1_9FLAO|nr:phosphoribosyltransferase [Flavobacterium terrigena]SEI93172.1 hypothetical protein SAMN05660918_1958 [Flavobacterium terrigena]